MPDATPATPANGAAPEAPQTPAGAAPPEPVPPKPGPDIDALRADLAKKERLQVLERRKFAEQKKAFETERQSAAELKKTLEQAKLNPQAFLEKLYGPKYYDVITETRLNGVPPAQLIASEVEKVREEFRAQLEEREKAQAEAQKGSQEARIAQARRQLVAESGAYLESAAKEHGVLLAAVQGEGVLPAMLAQRIEQEYSRSEKRDPETGEVLVQGRILSTKDAAEQAEAEVLALVDRVVATEAYRARQQKAQASKEASPVFAGAPKLERRNTLSNDLTGTTRSKPAVITDEERRARAVARFNEVYKGNE